MSILATEETTPKARPLPSTYSLDTEFSEEFLARRYARLTGTPEKIVYDFTQDPGLLFQYYQLREEMFISVWGLKHFCGQKDQFDDTSEILIAHSKRQCVAGGRLTISAPAARQLMPMEKEGLDLVALFPDLKLNECSYGEFSRLSILPEYRGGAVFPEIARRFIKRAIAEGVQYAFNIAPQPLARSYRQTVQLFGLNWEERKDVVVPEREEYEGIKMVLSVMDLTRFGRPKPASIEQKANFSRSAALAD